MIRWTAILTALLATAPAVAGDARPSMPFYGTATLSADGTMALHLTRTDDGKPVDTTLTFVPADNGYDSVRRHLNGIAPGQTRPITPWKD